MLTSSRRSFAADGRPRIEDYLERSPELRPELVRELLNTEIELRRKAGEDPNVDDYEKRFPEDLDIVLAELGEELPKTLDRESPDEQSLEEEPQPERIGRYEIRRRLGRGGFGIVYLAHDPQLNRPVAIKIPRRKRFKSAEQVAAFINEARTAANLKHASLVAVHDVQEEDGPALYRPRVHRGREPGAAGSGAATIL